MGFFISSPLYQKEKKKFDPINFHRILPYHNLYRNNNNNNNNNNTPFFKLKNSSFFLIFKIHIYIYIYILIVTTNI